MEEFYFGVIHSPFKNRGCVGIYISTDLLKKFVESGVL